MVQLMVSKVTLRLRNAGVQQHRQKMLVTPGRAMTTEAQKSRQLIDILYIDYLSYSWNRFFFMFDIPLPLPQENEMNDWAIF